MSSDGRSRSASTRLGHHRAPLVIVGRAIPPITVGMDRWRLVCWLARFSTAGQQLISAEADAVRGAGYGERSPKRVNSRRGYPTMTRKP
jgi:hypothetical protein